MIGDIRHALNQALSEEFEKRGLTQQNIADLLGKNKSFISRKFSGDTNMTLETLADLAYALDRPVRISLPERDKLGGNNHHTMYGTTSGAPSPSTVATFVHKVRPATSASATAAPEPISSNIKVGTHTW